MMFSKNHKIIICIIWAVCALAVDDELYSCAIMTFSLLLNPTTRRYLAIFRENVRFKSNQIKSYQVESMFRNYSPLSGLKNWLHHFSLPQLSIILVLLLVNVITIVLFSQLIKSNLQWNKMEQNCSSIWLKCLLLLVLLSNLILLIKVSISALFLASKQSINGAMCFDALLLHSVEIIHY